MADGKQQFDQNDVLTHLVNWETVRAPLCPESETAKKNGEMYLSRNDIRDLKEAMEARGLHNKTENLSALHSLLINMQAWLDAKKGGN